MPLSVGWRLWKFFVDWEHPSRQSSPRYSTINYSNSLLQFHKEINMSQIEIFEQYLTNGDDKKGKMAILRGRPQSENPTSLMNDAVSKYVDNSPYNEFIEIEMDNPWVRVVVGGINKLNYEEFKNQKLND
ncbi:hypothetical protein [Longimonas halophila]|uniref:hypothetical protein n=1 Tax=Longimonas halophila TaxID=1469170 RepID=UPI0011420222|nr:hypothetical protein [Longimonas halophila]